MKHYLLLILGVAACATSVILIKASHSDPAMLAAARLLVAAALLSPLAIRAFNRSVGVTVAGVFRITWVPAILLALHFITWADGARRTPAANSSLIVNLTAVVMPILTLLFLSLPPTRRELLGTVLAMLGVAVLTIPKINVDRDSLLGDLVCFGSMLLFAGYLLAARMRRGTLDLWLYVTPIYAIAGIMCAVIAALRGTIFLPDLPEATMLIGLAVVPTIIGHSILNHSMNTLSPQAVSVFNLGQFLFAGLFAWMIFSEVPSTTFWSSSALVMAGALICIGYRRAPVSAITGVPLSPRS